MAYRSRGAGGDRPMRGGTTTRRFGRQKRAGTNMSFKQTLLELNALKLISASKRLIAPKGTLFEGDDSLFKTVAGAARSYAEYGCGASTIWMAQNTDAAMLSVDTSEDWIKAMREKVGNDRADLQWIDCGPLRKWGVPRGFEKRANFKTYTQAPWVDERSADVVLVDGRFRVACFLESLAHAAPGTKIFFDDYTDRPHYHVVEELVERQETCGRQCLFEVPACENLDIDKLTHLREKFEYVMD